MLVLIDFPCMDKKIQVETKTAWLLTILQNILFYVPECINTMELNGNQNCFVTNIV